jgi:hypothetical protein
MDMGQILFISTRLVLGAAACFFAIMLWSKTRDAAWMLMVIGIIIAYIDIVYSILDFFGIGGGNFFLIDSVPLISFILSPLQLIFFIAAFAVMVRRHSRRN